MDRLLDWETSAWSESRNNGDNNLKYIANETCSLFKNQLYYSGTVWRIMNKTSESAKVIKSINWHSNNKAFKPWKCVLIWMFISFYYHQLLAGCLRTSFFFSLVCKHYSKCITINLEIYEARVFILSAFFSTNNPSPLYRDMAHFSSFSKQQNTSNTRNPCLKKTRLSPLCPVNGFFPKDRSRRKKDSISCRLFTLVGKTGYWISAYMFTSKNENSLWNMKVTLQVNLRYELYKKALWHAL